MAHIVDISKRILVGAAAAHPDPVADPSHLFDLAGVDRNNKFSRSEVLRTLVSLEKAGHVRFEHELRGGFRGYCATSSTCDLRNGDAN